MIPRQYDLQQTRHVGRLDLEAEGLARYVDALLRDWAGLAPDITSTLGWSVDNGSGDITTLMAASVGRVIHDRFREDPEAALRAGARFLTGGDATGARLQDAIAAHRPALIVTTSHGATSPLEDVPAMRSRLGLPVDANEEPLDPAALDGDAAPSGAVFFAQACCSAGSTAPSDYEGVLAEGSIVEQPSRT